MKSLILVCVLGLVGCAAQPKTEVLVKTEYVVRTAPDQLKRLPEYPDPGNLDTADQTQLARFIANIEGYTYELESIISNLIAFYEKPVTMPITTNAAPTAVNNAYVDPIQRRKLGIN